jgi:Fur family transcriptional regulator, ferric uptake regulator
MQTIEKFAILLRKEGFKATPGRLSLLSILAKADHPLSIGSILEELRGSLDQATVYRALETLADVGIVRRVDIGHGHADYELSEGERHHHHHLICKSCGKVEDVDYCDAAEIENAVLKKSRAFSKIDTHSLEFFGKCKKCE